MRRSVKKQKKDLSAPAGKRKRYLVWGSIALGVIAVFGLLVLGLRNPDVIHGLQHYLGLQRGHDEDVVYDTSTGLPPAGGVHSPRWQNCGIYDEPIASKNAVHSLEHGAVWVTYNPSLAESEVAKLRDLVQGESFVLMSPFVDQASPIVLTAWGLQLEVDEADDGRIPNFINAYQLGPQTPEPGASCSNGVGEPVG
ncbi:MAG: DUF3105 domain-containing protein [Anaerolineales bacterium]|nr:DUF3105 domain-containing protein [Anaerolineales bacterium]MCA9975065.1 DUF3105 domain-containing protein [Anaerolineales bacterium]